MTPPAAPATTAVVRQRLETLAARRGAPGVQYRVSRHGRPWLEVCGGLADTAPPRPVTPATTFNAYSLAKPVTAAAVLALAAAGRLDLDAPIGTAAGVAGLQHYGSVRDTLLHRAGLRNPNPLRWFHPAERHAGFDEAAFVQARVAALAGSRRRLARSGYSNVGYLLLGLAVERAWGGPFVQAVRALVIEPLRLEPGEVLGFEIGAPARHAPGHLRRHGLLHLLLGLLVDRKAIVQGGDGSWVRLALHQVDGSAYGGLIANARGLVRFGEAVAGTGPGLAPAVRRLSTEEVPGPGPGRSLAWFTGRTGRHRWLAHAGGGLGGYGELRLYPDLGAVSSLLTNGPGLVDARCLDRIDAAWIDDTG